MMSLAAAFQLLLVAGSSASFLRNQAGMQVGPIDEDTILEYGNSTTGWGTFDQLLDHSKPELGTFTQVFTLIFDKISVDKNY